MRRQCLQLLLAADVFQKVPQRRVRLAERQAQLPTAVEQQAQRDGVGQLRRPPVFGDETLGG